MRAHSVLALSVLLIATLAGCGGGNRTADTAGTRQEFSFGALSGRAAKTNPPVLTNAAGVSAIGLTGAIQSLELRDVSRNLAATKIAFAASRDGRSQIYMMNPDGSNQQNISQSTSSDFSPAWSPDGTRIAFTSGRDGNKEIYVMNADGSNQRNLTRHANDDEFPAWSPDGTKIAFDSFRDGNFEIYVMNADGTNQHNLSNSAGDDFQPSWSPDGSKIAFTANHNGDFEIFVMNADGSNQHNLSNNAGEDTNPAWSPDGAKIAFQTIRDGNEEIYVMNADGSSQRNLTNNSGDDSFPFWSPDGTKIVFVTARDLNDQEVFVMNADGSNQQALTNNSTDDGSTSWSPFPSRRKLIGAGGQMGATSAGFVFTQTGDAVPASIVTFNTASVAGLVLTSQTGSNSTGSSLVYNLEGVDGAVTLSDLRYWNLANPAPVQVIPSSGLNANGALISFGAKTGLVRSILPFAAPNRSASGARPTLTLENGHRAARGRFVGVWDAAGNNLAPHGASQVQLDPETGDAISVR